MVQEIAGSHRPLVKPLLFFVPFRDYEKNHSMWSLQHEGYNVRPKTSRCCDDTWKGQHLISPGLCPRYCFCPSVSLSQHPLALFLAPYLIFTSLPQGRLSGHSPQEELWTSALAYYDTYQHALHHRKVGDSYWTRLHCSQWNYSCHECIALSVMLSAPRYVLEAHCWTNF